MLNLKKIEKKDYSLVEVDFLNIFSNEIMPEGEYLQKNAKGEICYNLKFENGKLKDNFGVTELVLPEERNKSDVYEKTLSYPGTITFKKAWRYKYYSLYNSRYEYVLLLYASDGKVYYNNIYSINCNLYSVGNFTFSEEPTLIEFRINGADCVGFATSTNNLVVWNCDSSPYQVSNSVKFRSICQSNGRLFAIEDGANYVVRYSSSVTDPTLWTSSDPAGFARVDLDDFRGELRKLVCHLDNVYVFRDFGISKLQTTLSGVSASNVYNSSTKIYAKTVCVCNDDIYFLAEDGLYKFDGYHVNKISLGIFDNFKKYLQEGANTCFFDGKLYIACYLKFSNITETVKNNSVIVYDVVKNSCSVVYGVEVCSMLALKDLNTSKLLFVVSSTVEGVKLWEMCMGKDSQLTFNKKYETNRFYLTDDHTKKILKFVKILSPSNMTLTITTDMDTRVVSITGKNSMQKILLNVVGPNFRVKVESSSKEFLAEYLKFVFAVRKN